MPGPGSLRRTSARTAARPQRSADRRRRTGLRPVRNRLTVAESVSVVGSRLVWTTPKTHQVRSVPVPPALMRHIEQECRGRGAADLLFPAPKGGPLRLNNWRRRVFDPAVERAGIVDLTPHDLRHTAALLPHWRGGRLVA